MNVKQVITSLERRRRAVGVERDKLRELRTSIEELEETCCRAYDSLTEAVDALSELA